jgi:hypothetical protein
VIEPKTAPIVWWIDPLEEPAPKGKKLLLLGYTGTAVLGTWADEGYVAFGYLPKIPPHIKRRIGCKAAYEEFLKKLNEVLHAQLAEESIQEEPINCCFRGSPAAETVGSGGARGEELSDDAAS